MEQNRRTVFSLSSGTLAKISICEIICICLVKKEMVLIMLSGREQKGGLKKN